MNTHSKSSSEHSENNFHFEHINGIDFSWFPREALDSAGWTAFSIFSTAEDLAWWAQALFGGSVLGEEYLGLVKNASGFNARVKQVALDEGVVRPLS